MPNDTATVGDKDSASYTRLGRRTIDQQCACELWEQKYNADYAKTMSRKPLRTKPPDVS